MTVFLFYSALVYFRIAQAVYTAVSSSVIGMANHNASAETTGSARINPPLMTRPRATDTTKAAFGFKMAWK